tara:strand:+ start:458 stop:568 length:111 start_codon:yes stop_codon:yes gene_type:complete
VLIATSATLKTGSKKEKYFPPKNGNHSGKTPFHIGK